MSEKIIITGGGGFLGSHLVDKYVNDGYEVHVIDICFCERPHFNESAIYHFIDLCTTPIDNLSKIVEGSLLIIHCAALARVQLSFDDPKRYYNNNVISTLNLIDCLKSIEYKGKFIFISSSSVYNGIQPLKVNNTETDQCLPSSPYALSKVHCEELVMNYGKWFDLNVNIVRPFNIYGDRMANGSYATVLQIFLDTFKDNKPLKIVGNGSQKRDFTYISDVIQGIDRVFKSDVSGEIFNLGSGQNVSILDVANLFPCKKIFIEKRDEPENTLANVDKLKSIGYNPSYNVINWLQSKIME